MAKSYDFLKTGDGYDILMLLRHLFLQKFNKKS